MKKLRKRLNFWWYVTKTMLLSRKEYYCIMVNVTGRDSDGEALYVSNNHRRIKKADEHYPIMTFIVQESANMVFDDYVKARQKAKNNRFFEISKN